ARFAPDDSDGVGGSAVALADPSSVFQPLDAPARSLGDLCRSDMALAHPGAVWPGDGVARLALRATRLLSRRGVFVLVCGRQPLAVEPGVVALVACAVSFARGCSEHDPVGAPHVFEPRDLHALR